MKNFSNKLRLNINTLFSHPFADNAFSRNVAEKQAVSRRGFGRARSISSLAFSAAIVALLTAPATVSAEQLVVTDGSTEIRAGVSFTNVSDAVNGAALYSANSSKIIGTDLELSGGSHTSAVVYAENGGTVELNGDTTINGGRGLTTSGGGAKITMTGGTITSNVGGAAVAKSGSSILLTDVTIIDSSIGEDVGAFQAYHGTITMTGGSITAKGSARGVDVDSGTAVLENVSISSVATGLYNKQNSLSDQPNLSVTNFSVETTGNSAYGLDANVSSNTELENGTIHTHGADAHGIRVSPFNIGEALVTGAGLTIRTEGGSAHGVFNESGIVTLTDTDITVAQAYGLYAQRAGTISLTGGSLAVNGAGWAGALATGAGSRIDLDGVVVTTTADGTDGLYSANQSVVTAKNGTVSVAGAGSAGIFSASQGTVNIENTTVTATGADSHGLVFLGATALNQISVTGGSVSSPDGTAILASGGTDALSLTGTAVSGDTLLFAGAYTAAGSVYGAKLALTADHSTLRGGALVDPDSTATLALNNGSTWTLAPSAAGAADSAVSVLNLNDSTVAFAAPAAGAYQTLTVGAGVPGTAAVYSATGNARLQLHTFLNEGGALSNQKTDRLLVNGDVTGTTLVTVTGVAGSPGGATSPDGRNLASEGISIVQVSGAATEGSFQLLGGYVTLNGMPYQYTLHGYGPGARNGAADESQRLVTGTDPYWDYRLQSVYVAPPGPAPEPPARAVAPQVASYLIAPTALFQAGLADIANLHRRLGEIRDDRATGRNAGATGEVFIRAYGGTYDYASNRNAYAYGYDADIDYAAVQMGGNLYAFEGRTGVTRFGVAGTIGALSFDPKNVTGTSATDLDTWSVSAYGTYLHDSGWYIDGILSYGGFDGHVSTGLRGRTAGLSGSSFSASLETGYPFALGSGLVVEPQAQVIYQRLMFDAKRDIDGFPVRLGDQDQVTARVGARLAKTYAPGERDRLMTVYAKVNVLHSFDGGGKAFFGDTFRLGQFGTSVEGGLGLNATLSKNLSLYADAAYQHRVGRSGVSGATFTGGLRYSF